MEMTRECTSFTLDLRDKLLSLQIDSGYLRAAYENLMRTSGFEPSHETIAPKVLEGCHCSKLLSFNLDLPRDAIGAVCHYISHFSTYFHIILCADFVETLTKASNSCWSSARASMSSANR